MKTLLLTLICFVSLTSLFSQTSDNKVTLSGYVKDSANGESIVGATISIEGTDLSSTSNVYGFYSLSVSPGNYTVNVTQSGFTVSRMTVQISVNLTKNFELSKVEDDFKGVSIKAKKEKILLRRLI